MIANTFVFNLSSFFNPNQLPINPNKVNFMKCISSSFLFLCNIYNNKKKGYSLTFEGNLNVFCFKLSYMVKAFNLL